MSAIQRIMKKLLGLIITISCLSTASLAQDSTLVESAPAKPRKVSPVNLTNRSNDHLMIQLSNDRWANAPDTIQNKGISRGFNIYLMYDMPFKTNPHFSVAAGAGISTSNIYFENTYIDIAGRNKTRLDFQDVGDTTHYKKYKMLTTYLEAPVELRYLFNPENSNKSWKVALGVKIGTMLSATTKGKLLQSSTGQTVNNHVMKEKSKRFFNSTRLSATARAGYGNFSLFGSYQLNAFVKEGFGPDIKPFQIGLTISGL